jgi:hypothetical protein
MKGGLSLIKFHQDKKEIDRLMMQIRLERLFDMFVLEPIAFIVAIPSVIVKVMYCFLRYLLVDKQTKDKND